MSLDYSTRLTYEFRLEEGGHSREAIRIITLGHGLAGFELFPSS
jgi:hypothetical protein